MVAPPLPERFPPTQTHPKDLRFRLGSPIRVEVITEEDEGTVTEEQEEVESPERIGSRLHEMISQLNTPTHGHIPPFSPNLFLPSHAPPLPTPSLPLPTPPPTQAFPPSLNTILDQFLLLADLPTILKPLFGYLVPSFTTKCGELADQYLSDPTETNLYFILAFIKVGVVPSLRAPRAKEAIQAYPSTSFPEVTGRLVGGGVSLAKKVTKLVETGRLRSAARVLASEAKIAEVDAHVADTLRALHPPGEDNPFGTTVGPSQDRAPNEEDISAGILSFKPDTSPGISGWTVPLLRLASRSLSFVRFLTALTAGISSNTAPGCSMLAVSRLTPLLKAQGGIRPIAVGELFYRLATKVLLKRAFKEDSQTSSSWALGAREGWNQSSGRWRGR